MRKYLQSPAAERVQDKILCVVYALECIEELQKVILRERHQTNKKIQHRRHPSSNLLANGIMTNSNETMETAIDLVLNRLYSLLKYDPLFRYIFLSNHIYITWYLMEINCLTPSLQYRNALEYLIGVYTLYAAQIKWHFPGNSMFGYQINSRFYSVSCPSSLTYYLFVEYRSLRERTYDDSRSLYAWNWP